jgi:hypothetical protein
MNAFEFGYAVGQQKAASIAAQPGSPGYNPLLMSMRGGLVTDPTKLQQMNTQFQNAMSSGAAQQAVQGLQPRPFQSGTQTGIMPQRPQEPQTSTLRVPGMQPLQQKTRQQFEQGVGKTFGQGAQKVVTGVNNALDTMRNMPGMSRRPQFGNI